MTLQNVFLFNDKGGQYLKDKKIDKAYTAIKEEVKFGPTLNFARLLVKSYAVSMWKKQTVEAEQVFEQVRNLFKESIKTGPSELKSLGDDLCDGGKQFESVLFYLLSTDYFLSDKIADSVAVDGIVSCVHGIHGVAVSLGKNNKELITTCLIPLAYGLVKNLDGYREKLEEKVFYSKKAWCYRFIGECKSIAGDGESSEDVYRQGVKFLETNLGENAKGCLIYGMLNRTLGRIHQDASRYDASLEYYTNALASFRITSAYTEDKKRKKAVKEIEKELKTVTNKYKKQQQQQSQESK